MGNGHLCDSGWIKTENIDQNCDHRDKIEKTQLLYQWNKNCLLKTNEITFYSLAVSGLDAGFSSDTIAS